MKAFTEQIAEAKNIEELKEVGKRVYNAKLTNKKRAEVVNAYRTKRRELERAYVNESKNNTFKHMLYLVNTMAKEGVVQVAKVGKTLYELTKAKNLNSIEADIAFRAYNYQKNKAGIRFART